ncbi:WD-repeat protein [Gregarina niphandrodes]|uniref:WD-repeat protein n=1 Tax=Gregarina niphandrodes TaxID=110365 RepID=A0A023B9N4_GRENI|nr:WD-repeat protein [Gregarina niphandrodes]EZG72975.1 WD-repeat protein [Gregarina niphandrodes]|eukprot:XP_011129670.1 WD-repeat protein [Gregarina niphandrodes]
MSNLFGAYPVSSDEEKEQGGKVQGGKEQGGKEQEGKEQEGKEQEGKEQGNTGETDGVDRTNQRFAMQQTDGESRKRSLQKNPELNKGLNQGEDVTKRNKTGSPQGRPLAAPVAGATVQWIEDMNQHAKEYCPVMVYSTKAKLAESETVTTLSVAPNGRRLVVGSGRGKVLMFYFATMVKDGSVVEQWADFEGLPVLLLKYDRSTKFLMIAAGEPFVEIRNNDNAVVWQTYKGDMYVRDTANTFGHTHRVTDGFWLDGDHIMTTSEDTTVRVFNRNSKPKGLDQRIPSSCVYKTIDRENKSLTKQTRVCCAQMYDNNKILVAGCADGSIQIWDGTWRSGIKSQKPKKVIRLQEVEPVEKIIICNIEPAPDHRPLSDGNPVSDGSPVPAGDPVPGGKSRNNLPSSSGQLRVYARTPTTIACFDLFSGSLLKTIKLSGSRLGRPLMALYSANKHDSYILTVDHDNRIVWFTFELDFVKALELPCSLEEGEVFSALYVSPSLQLFAGTSKGNLIAYWTEENKDQGAGLMKEASSKPVESAVAQTVDSSYSIYELPEHVKYYNDDTVKE